MPQQLRYIGLFVLWIVLCASPALADEPWRTLPLVTDSQVDKSWMHTGWGQFVVDGDALRTECDGRGMGLLVWPKEKFGDCQIRVVFRSQAPKSNAGVYVRVDDGLLATLKEPPLAVERDKDGKLPEDELKKLMAASEAAQGVWYAVHHGYEVQICDGAEPLHRTGAIYSLAKAAVPKKPPTEWKTMIITLRGKLIEVEIDGQRVSSFDPDISADRIWYEPKREPKRPTAGYLALQNHDPGDVVWFKEVSVRPLPQKP